MIYLKYLCNLSKSEVIIIKEKGEDGDFNDEHVSVWVLTIGVSTVPSMGGFIWNERFEVILCREERTFKHNRKCILFGG